MSDKITIIIPTFNRSKLLSRAIESVRRQTYTNLEIIIVDDASTDETPQLVHSITDDRIKYFQHASNKGGSASRNTGILAATGEYICFLDDDDELHPQKLTQQLKLFQNSSTKLGAVYCGWEYLFENKITSQYLPKFRGNVFKKFLQHCFTVTPALLIKKECFVKAGIFDVNLKGCQDWDMWIRISKYYEFDFIPQILTTILIHGDQISSKLKDKISARRLILNKYLTELEKNPKAYSTQLSRLGALYYVDQQKNQGLKLIYKSIKIFPLILKNYLYIMLMVTDIFIEGVFEKFVIETRGKTKLYY